LYEQAVVPNEQYYSVYNTLTGAIRPVRLKGTEPATIDYVAVNGANSKGFLEKVRAPSHQVKDDV
jgi:DNA-directed RNA polymerase I subunit RPA2